MRIYSGVLLEELRKGRGLTRGRLAERISAPDDQVSRQVVDAWCNGHRATITPERAERLADALGVGVGIICRPDCHVRASA